MRVPTYLCEQDIIICILESIYYLISLLCVAPLEFTTLQNIVFLNLYAVCLYNCSYNRRAYVMYYIILLYVMLYTAGIAVYPFSELSVFSLVDVE